MKKILIATVVTLTVLIILLLIILVVFPAKKEIPNSDTQVLDYKNLTYVVENQPIKLAGGTSKYFGNEAKGDLNGDGMEDVAFLLTQEPGGSGTFFYLAVALKTNASWQPLNTMFLGDRIAPQTTEFHDGQIVVNYAERKPGEPMTTRPSVGVSRYFNVTNGVVAEKLLLAPFGQSVSFAIDKQITFEDGLMVTLKEINDSRCKKDVVCVWAGELSPVFDILTTSVPNQPIEVRLGVTTAQKVSKGGYTFELKDASETTATIIVTKVANK